MRASLLSIAALVVACASTSARAQTSSDDDSAALPRRAIVRSGNRLALEPAAQHSFSMGRAGPWMLNLKLGFNRGIFQASNDGFGWERIRFSTESLAQEYQAANDGMNIQIDLGRLIAADSNLYLILPVQFTFATSTINTDTSTTSNILTRVILPLGVQYDLPLLGKNFFLTVRAALGYMFTDFKSTGIAADQTQTPSIKVRFHHGFFAPELGLKWVYRGRLNIGADLLSIPVAFSVDEILIGFRMFFYLGLNFGAPSHRPNLGEQQ